MAFQYRPKFNVNDIVVIMKDSFNYEPVEAAILISKIKSIVILYKERLDGKPSGIYYHISDLPDIVKEDEVELYINE